MTIAILAGGESRRMGQDKAALFLETVQQAARGTGLPVVVVGRSALPDLQPGQGPLGGLATALTQTQDTVLAVACDMPALDTDAFLWLLAQWEALPEKPLGLIVEPLFAIYTPACLPRLLARLEAGKRSVHGLIESGGFLALDPPADLVPRLANVNTPEEWEQYRYSTRKP